MDWRQARDVLLAEEPQPPLQLGEVHETGLYAWWDLSGALQPFFPQALPPVDSSRPLYVGLAERQPLADRGLDMHLKATRMSTVRRSLTALLQQELDLVPGVQPAPKQKFGLATAEEVRLTAWMLANLHVTWVVHPSPGSIEKQLVRDLLPPLNDHFAHHGGYWKVMRATRAALWRKAGGVI